MLKIDIVTDGIGSAATVRLVGRVIGPWVEELRQACERLLAEVVGITLDLSEVVFVDRDGVDLLRRLAERSVALVNCSGFVAEQLRAEAWQ
jgi:anti-anti-sigma regulatory factor